MIELNNISFTYPNGRKALSGINGRLESGMYLLAGENGAGKTTLLHAIAGLVRPQDGSCVVNGVKSTTDNPDEMGHIFLLEENMYVPGKSIRNFAAIHTPFYPEFSEELFTKNLQAFGQSGLEPLRSLSLGNLKKAHLAYVLALGVDLLLLDEPTNALDIEGREIFRKILSRSMRPDSTVIISTHNVSDLEKLFDGALMMKGSRLLFAGTDEDVTSRLAFEYASDRDDEALYSDPQGTRYLNIYPSSGDEETRIDWKALYMALHSDNSQKIIDQLCK
ncbi:MAG: ABC transporter ATP-binding protein [Muribaculaceae bacterium]|nr:ABC transporter ATP-binding protein [Muribaculaceae bacterium]